MNRHGEIAILQLRQIQIPTAFDLGAEVILHPERALSSGHYVVVRRHSVRPRGTILLARRNRIWLAQLCQSLKFRFQLVPAGRFRRWRDSVRRRVRWWLSGIRLGKAAGGCCMGMDALLWINSTSTGTISTPPPN